MRPAKASKTTDAGSGTAETDPPPVLSKPMSALMSALVTAPEPSMSPILEVRIVHRSVYYFRKAMMMNHHGRDSRLKPGRSPLAMPH
jgi:hypothetical protein